MPDGLYHRVPADAARVNLDDEVEVRYWADKFGCPPERVRAAVLAAGDSAVAVEVHVRGAKQA